MGGAESEDDRPEDVVGSGPRPARVQASGGNAGPVYGLGVIGAMVWYWQTADNPRDRAVGVLKAFTWPAFLVYHALKFFRA